MLEFYVESGFRLRQLRECATGGYMDPFSGWLQSAGYRRRPAQLLLRGAAHLGEWASIEQVQIGQFDQRVLDAFTGHNTLVFKPGDSIPLEVMRDGGWAVEKYL